MTTGPRLAFVLQVASVDRLSAYEGLGGDSVDFFAVMPDVVGGRVGKWTVLPELLQSEPLDELARHAESLALEGYGIVAHHVDVGPGSERSMMNLLGGASLEEAGAAVRNDLQCLGFVAIEPSDSVVDLGRVRRVLATLGVSQSTDIGTWPSTFLVRGFALGGLAQLARAGLAGHELSVALTAYLASSGLAPTLRGFTGREAGSPPAAIARRARVWAVLDENEPLDLAGAAEIGIEEFLSLLTWKDGRFLRSAAPLTEPARVAPYVRIDAGESTIDVEDLARSIVLRVAESNQVRMHDKPVVVLDETLATLGGLPLVEALRASSESADLDLWLASTESPAVWDGKFPVFRAMDGLVQVAPSRFDTRKRLYRDPNLEHVSGQVVALGTLSGGGRFVSEARKNSNLIPGAFTRHDSRVATAGSYGHQWSPMKFRAMLERSVRSVAARSDAERVVVVNSWNRRDDRSGMQGSDFDARVARAILRDAVAV
jgi:hypothetical protein